MKPQVSTGAPPGTRTPNPRIKSPLLCSIFPSELVLGSAETCRELPFCPVAGIRGVPRIPDAAGAYRGIRANMEQTSMAKGLDHHTDASWEAAGRGCACRGQRYRFLARREASPATGAGKGLQTRLVIPAGCVACWLVLTAPPASWAFELRAAGQPGTKILRTPHHRSACTAADLPGGRSG